MRHCAVQMHLSLSLFLSLFLCSSIHAPVYGHLPIQKLPASHKLRVRNCWRRVRNYSFTRQSSFHCFVYVYVKYRICAVHVQNCTVYAQSASTWNLDHQSTWLALVQGCSEGEGEAARFSTAEVVAKEEAGTGWYRPLMANRRPRCLLCAASGSTPTVQALRSLSRFYLAWLQTHQQRKAAVKLQAFHRGNKARQEALWMVD